MQNVVIDSLKQRNLLCSEVMNHEKEEERNKTALITNCCLIVFSPQLKISLFNISSRNKSLEGWKNKKVKEYIFGISSLEVRCAKTKAKKNKNKKCEGQVGWCEKKEPPPHFGLILALFAYIVFTSALKAINEVSDTLYSWLKKITNFPHKNEPRDIKLDSMCSFAYECSVPQIISLRRVTHFRLIKPLEVVFYKRRWY